MIPVAGAIIAICAPKRLRFLKEASALTATAINLFLIASLFKKEISYTVPWAGFGIDISFRLYNFSAFILLATAAFGMLITLYSCVFMKDRPRANQFYAYLLLSVASVNGAVLSDNLVCMLFFWESLLVTLFGLIAIGGKGSFKTAAKALIIVGISDLCMMIGIALTGYASGTLTISKISMPLNDLGGVAFILLMIGAIAKAGSMPFHTWIPDAATDAPLPFMAIFPGALEKLVGIYFLTRISLDMFKLEPGSWVSIVLMVIGAVTILFAVMMALIQKNYKRLLSYHAISQVGYMILGIGTLVPAGIVGGLFHMINNALYKSCLFLTGGAVEKQTGTTDLEKLGGLARKMPVTFACFFIAAVSISGVPPFNGFFSKELIYDGALERGRIFYMAALLGSFLTAASFLKLGHAAYIGKASSKEAGDAKEAAWPMLIPMIFISGACVVFGVWNSLPIDRLIVPIVGARAAGAHHLSGFPANPVLVIATVAVLLAALVNHIFGVKRTGSGLKAIDHIHYAPGIKQAYNMAEKGSFDPYNIGMAASGLFAGAASAVDRINDWIYNSLIPGISGAVTFTIRIAHTGSYKVYVIWSLVGVAAIAIYFLR